MRSASVRGPDLTDIANVPLPLGPCKLTCQIGMFSLTWMRHLLRNTGMDRKPWYDYAVCRGQDKRLAGERNLAPRRLMIINSSTSCWHVVTSRGPALWNCEFVAVLLGCVVELIAASLRYVQYRPSSKTWSLAYVWSLGHRDQCSEFRRDMAYAGEICIALQHFEDVYLFIFSQRGFEGLFQIHLNSTQNFH